MTQRTAAAATVTTAAGTAGSWKPPRVFFMKRQRSFHVDGRLTIKQFIVVVIIFFVYFFAGTSIFSDEYEHRFGCGTADYIPSDVSRK